MKTRIPTLIILFSLLISFTNSLFLRSHQQMTTFADIITTSNRINEQVIPETSTQTSRTPTPKIAAGIIIPIICVGLCVIFCFFCLKCAQNEQEQAERGLEESIPCYCGPFKLMFKCCKYLLCVDVILRCLGLRRTNFEKQEEKRLKEEEERRKKEEKERLKWQKKHGTAYQPQGSGPNPYQTQMRKQQQPQSNITWTQETNSTDIQKIRSQKCSICLKKHPNTLLLCPSHCPLHLQCLISYKTQNKMSKKSNQCPSCQKPYKNKVKYYCSKCNNKCTEMQLESGNVYVSQLDYGEAVKSVGGGKCDECGKKRWFWQ